METTGQIEIQRKYNLNNIPEADNPSLGDFANRLWNDAKREKITRLNMHSRWIELHKKFRGKKNKNKTYPLIGANYLFKTVQGFCAMLTEKYPKAETQTDEGVDPVQIKALNEDISKWWQEEELQKLLYSTVQNFQVYGTTIEKFIFDVENNTSKVILRDPFNFFPAPGYKLCNMKIPYCFDAYFLDIWDIKDSFDLPEHVLVPPDADEQLFGRQRETTRGGLSKSPNTSGNLPPNYAEVEGAKGSGMETKALILELWIRDKSVDTIPVYGEVQITYEGTDEPVYDDQGKPVLERRQIDKKTRPRYPGGIRKITFCPSLLKIYNNGILDDRKNPNVNWNLIEVRMEKLLAEGKPEYVIDEATEQPIIDEATGLPAIQNVPVDEDSAYALAHGSLDKTFLYNNFPFSAVSSLVDSSQWWGFSIIEQLEELTGKAEALLTKYLAYFEMVMFPIFINPKGSGVKNSQITNAPGVIINPLPEHAPLLRYILPPPPPMGILELIMFLLYQVDIVSGTPEVTEGRKPKGVSAASAIIALQDKAATLFQPQIWAVDRIVQHRGLAHISFVQNFGTEEKPIKVDDEFVRFLGIDLWGSFKYMVESGSSAPITKSGRRTQYIELFRIGAMDIQSLLEMLEIPNRIIERVLERFSVPGALQLLIDAGLPEEVAQQIYQAVLQNPGIGAPQGGPKGEGTQTQPTGANAGASDRAKQIYGQMRMQ